MVRPGEVEQADACRLVLSAVSTTIANGTRTTITDSTSRRS
jgi:hypothetical protein